MSKPAQPKTMPQKRPSTNNGAKKPRKHKRGVVDARGCALDLLDAVLARRRPLDEALSELDALDHLESRDRAFARALAATVLRRLGQLDVRIDACLDRPLANKTTGRTRELKNLLRLGAAQVLFMDVAAHAAVSTAVDMAQARAMGAYKKLVNAVLRRLAREVDAARKDGTYEATLLQNIRHNTPAWLFDAWEKAYGTELAEAIAAQHLQEPPLDISVSRDGPQWAETLNGTLLSSGSVRLWPSGPVNMLAGFDDGAWWVQDAAAALPAKLLGDIDGKRVVDLCAAPGGKTLQLCAAGAQVTAVERSKTRIKRIEENLARTGLRAKLICDNAETWRPEQHVDAVLLDAPCSATGTMRRHPDVAWLKSQNDVEGLARAQARLIDAALEMLVTGGVLIYCTCSLQTEEGEAQIEAALVRHPNLVRLPVTAAEIGGLAPAITPQGDMRTLPCHLGDVGGMDGFFAARLRKN